MTRGKYFRLGLFALLLLQSLAAPSNAQGKRSSRFHKVLIETPKPYDHLIGAIQARGGRVTQQFSYVDGIAAEIPDDALDDIRALVGDAALDKDSEVQRPSAVSAQRPRPMTGPQANRHQFGPVATPTSVPLPGIASGNLASFANAHPGAYSINNAGTRIEKLQGRGITGAGATVAVIDSGIRPGYKLLSGAVIGGIDFVDDGEPGPAGDTPADWKKNTNDGHGTFAASLIAGNAMFSIGGVMRDALEQYAPGALVDGKLPLIGTAPDAKVYVVRVFGDNAGAGASKSTILAAIQHVIEQRELYDRSRGRYGIKIDVANLSLGVSTLAAGRTLFERSIDAMLKAGIVPVVSSGNVGPAALTEASPGSSMSALTVGGSSRAANERILNEVFYGTEFPEDYYPGIGGDLRPFGGTEIAWFSSRGPNADGRLDPDVVASGVGNISQGYCPDQILDACFRRASIGSGTSFSAPIVAGIAASLIQAFPRASATEIRNAIVESGQTTGQISPYFDAVDRGRGLPDAYAAYQLLAAHRVDDSLPRVYRPDDLVRRNIEENTRLDVRWGFVTKTLRGLRPGERGEILYEVPARAERVIVKIRNVQMNGPQNPFYGGDALFFYAHSAKTSSIGAFGDYLNIDSSTGSLLEDSSFFGGEDEREFSFEDPDTGIMRFTLNPDTLNAGNVDVEISIETVREAWPRTTFEGTIRDGKTKKYTLEVPNGTSRLDFLLTWDHDWAHYPTNDIDLIVCSPDIPSTVADCKALGNKDGATLAGPERVSIDNPMRGTWTILVNGFSVPSVFDDFRVRVTKVR